ncbi:MAG: hypothetical protein HYU77_14115 [Betaproteobacteria bacterium]|nr:hypothetical protein [Betaproteobacteria bacterium]
MAKQGVIPVADMQRGAQALDDDLPKVLRGGTVEGAGWYKVDPLTLLVPLYGQREDGSTDFYLLKLYFSCYPEWPPSAQFVNPQTLKYGGPVDKKWLPRIEGTNEIAIHDNYGDPGIQLICCSVTLEFYQVLHGVEDKHLWDETTQNFHATLSAIRHVLKPPYYKGPQEARS